MILRISLFFCLAVVSKYSSATTFISSQDGEWEDSSSWNNISVADTLDGDTIIINNHINYNNNLVLSNCYLQIALSGSICGHDSIWLYSSKVIIYGGIYSDFVFGESSKWLCYSGDWVVTSQIHWGGMGADFLLSSCPGHVGEGFVCTNPVQTWKDTIQSDTIQTDTIIVPTPKPLLFISVYPNPCLDHFVINSEIPDSNSQVTLNIYDLIGREMKTISIPDGKSSLTIFTNGWPAGMYFLRFQQGESVIQTDKIIRVQ